MKLKFLMDFGGRETLEVHYSKGQIADIDEDTAKVLLRDGRAVEVFFLDSGVIVASPDAVKLWNKANSKSEPDPEEVKVKPVLVKELKPKVAPKPVVKPAVKPQPKKVGKER